MLVVEFVSYLNGETLVRFISVRFKSICCGLLALCLCFLYLKPFDANSVAAFGFPAAAAAALAR